MSWKRVSTLKGDLTKSRMSDCAETSADDKRYFKKFNRTRIIIELICRALKDLITTSRGSTLSNDCFIVCAAEFLNTASCTRLTIRLLYLKSNRRLDHSVRISSSANKHETRSDFGGCVLCCGGKSSSALSQPGIFDYSTIAML